MVCGPAIAGVDGLIKRIRNLGIEPVFILEEIVDAIVSGVFRGKIWV